MAKCRRILSDPTRRGYSTKPPCCPSLFMAATSMLLSATLRTSLPPQRKQCRSRARISPSSRLPYSATTPCLLALAPRLALLRCTNSSRPPWSWPTACTQAAGAPRPSPATTSPRRYRRTGQSRHVPTRGRSQWWRGASDPVTRPRCSLRPLRTGGAEG